MERSGPLINHWEFLINDLVITAANRYFSTKRAWKVTEGCFSVSVQMEIGLGLIGSCSKEQQKIYKDWFNLVDWLDSDGDARTTGNEGAKFFAVSKFSRPEHKHVWAIADSKRQGFLGFTEFVTAMQLISFAQEHELSPDILKSEVDWENITPPVIEGLDAFIAKTKSSTTNGMAMNGITPNQPSSQWSASKSVKRLYIEKLKSLEVAYHFNDFGNPLLHIFKKKKIKSGLIYEPTQLGPQQLRYITFLRESSDCFALSSPSLLETKAEDEEKSLV